jgi:RNase P/RNase MRP subunit p29
MKFCVCFIVAGLGLAASSVRAADAKGYQVTGPVLEVNANYIVVKKGEQNWQIAINSSTKSANVKVGDKVTVYYTMTATEIEPKAPKAPKADK